MAKLDVNQLRRKLLEDAKRPCEPFFKIVVDRDGRKVLVWVGPGEMPLPLIC